MASAFSWQKSAFSLVHFVLQGQICQLLQVSLDNWSYQELSNFLLLHSSPLYQKRYLLWLLVLEGLVGLHSAIQLHLLPHYWWGRRLGLL